METIAVACEPDESRRMYLESKRALLQAQHAAKQARLDVRISKANMTHHARNMVKAVCVASGMSSEVVNVAFGCRIEKETTTCRECGTRFEVK